MLSYWTTFTLPTIAISAVAGTAGALLIASNRSVLTAGVMMALGLVPSAAVVGLSLVGGDFGGAGKGAARWLIEAGIVVLTNLLVFQWKKPSIIKRRANA